MNLKIRNLIEFLETFFLNESIINDEDECCLLYSQIKIKPLLNNVRKYLKIIEMSVLQLQTRKRKI